jgi:N-acetylglucosamine malate deacetylase 1
MNVLAVGAHHDDIELGCGGTLARLAAQGHATFGITMTNSETHYDIRAIHRSAEDARNEAQKAATVLGLTLVESKEISRDNGTLTYDVKTMRWIERFIAANSISMVFSHWNLDLNTDHEAAAKTTLVAARHVPCILMYRSNWYQVSAPFNGIFFVDISDVVDRKRRCLECYQTEIKNRGRAWIDSFFDASRTFGFGVDRAYAEVFEPVRYEVLAGDQLFGACPSRPPPPETRV